MSEDTFTEITTESWFSRIGSAFKGIIFGLVLFIAAFPLLFWNEGRAVKRYKTLNEGAGSVVSSPEGRVLSENEGKLVHVSGKAVTDEIVADAEFKVAVNAIKLKRNVEMYQWKEIKKRKSKKKLGGGKKTVTTYSYSKNWSANLIDSNNFKKPKGHQNPDSMPYHSQEFIAGEVSLGEFILPTSLVGKINKASILPVRDMANIEGIPNAAFHGGGIYFGENPTAPQIGDLRISYRIVEPTEVSVVSRQVDFSFEPYRAEAGGTINMLSLGIIGADGMFQRAHQSNTMWTWIFRLGGFLIMLVGVAMVLKPLSVLADVIPFLGSIAGAGAGILSFLIAAPFAFFTIAIAWLRYRPVLAISFLIMAAVLIALIFVLSKRGKSAKTVPIADPQPQKRRSHNELIPGGINQEPSGSSSSTQTGTIPASIIQTIPQSAKTEDSQVKAEDLLKKGQNYFRTKQYEKAVMEFSQVIKSGGNRKTALYNRGVALFKLNKKEAALKDFNYAAKLGHAKARTILNQIKPA